MGEPSLGITYGVFRQDEQPSSPMAAQIRRAKRMAQCSNSGSTSSRSPQQQQQPYAMQEGIQQEGGINQAQLDRLCEGYALPPEGELWQQEQPSSPQAQKLLRQRRQKAAASSNAGPSVVASGALGGAVMSRPVGISQNQLDSLSMSCPASPVTGNGVAVSSQSHQQVMPSIESAPFFPYNDAQDGDSSPQAHRLRWAKRAGQQAAAGTAQHGPSFHQSGAPGDA